MSKRQKLIEAVARLGRDGLENIAMTPDPLPPPAPETRETILSAEQAAEMLVTEANMVRILNSHDALHKALSTERAARISVEQERGRIATEGLQLAAQVAFIRGGDIPSTIEAARAVLVNRAEQAEASLAAMTAERRGAAQVLMEIAQLPSPTHYEHSAFDRVKYCEWCDGRWPAEETEQHKPTCLWPRALAVVRPQGER